MPPLSTTLFLEVGPGFFRVLTGKYPAIYLDALEALERAVQFTSSLSKSESLDVVADVLRLHPEFIARDEFPEAGADAATLHEQAALILRRLVETGWLYEPPRADWQRIVYFSANGEILLAALRQIAKGEPAQFTDKLQLACTQLLNPDAFTGNPYADLEACLDNVRQGLRELRQMENGVARHTRNLLAAATLQENLAVLYDQFSESFGHACYRELVRAKLPTHIHNARLRLRQLSASERIVGLMQREHLRRSPECEPMVTAAAVRLKLDELDRLLESVGPQAEELDRRAADFARRAFARVRYLQEVSSGQRDKVQQLFAWIDEHHAGARFSELPDTLDLPALLICEAEILSADSLRKLALRRQAGEIEPLGDDLTDADRDAASKELEKTMRESVNILRANRFVARLPGPSGTKLSLTQLPLDKREDIVDLIACLLHAESRDAIYSLETERIAMDTADPPQYLRSGYYIEALVLEKR